MENLTNLTQNKGFDDPNKTKTLSDRQKRMIAALNETMGVVKAAAKKAKISRETHYTWLKSNLTYRDAVEDITNVILDFVESKMFQAINNGDVNMIKFYLLKKGRSRGYVESKQVVIEDLPAFNQVIIYETKPLASSEAEVLNSTESK